MRTPSKTDDRRSSSVPNETHNRKLLYNQNNNNIAQRTTVTNTEDSISKRESINITAPPSSSSSSKTQNESAVINQFPMPPSTGTMARTSNPTIIIPTKKLNHGRSSSSEPSATVGHDVTHGSLIRHVNKSDHIKPAENISSELPVALPVIDEKKMEISDLLQKQIQKMALNEDLVLLQRKVDRMQQQRVTDLEEQLTRVNEQKKRDEDILEQINLTKQRLELAIAGKLFEGNQQHQQTQRRGSFSSADHQPKPSNSTNTTRNSKLKMPREDPSYQQQRENNYYQRRRNRRSFPSFNRFDDGDDAYYPDLDNGTANFEFTASQHYPHHTQYGYPCYGNMMGGGFIDSPPRMRMNPTRRHPPHPSQEFAAAGPRSNSAGSQWFNPDFMDPQEQQQGQRFRQQHMYNQPPEMIIDLGYHHLSHTNQSRKSSLHSLRSDISDTNAEKVVGIDLQDEPVNLSKEDPVDSATSLSEEENEKRHHPQRHRRHHNGSRFCTAAKGSATRRPGIPPMMYPGAFVGGPAPPPYLFDREPMKMRPPPPPPPSFGYNNMPPPPPPGNEYFPYMPPPRRMSPRFMATFAADEQQQQQQPSWNIGMGQWGPPPPPHQNTYGMPPPPPPPDSATNPGGSGAKNHLPDQQPPPSDQPSFNGSGGGGGGGRRFNSATTSALGQQPPPSSIQQQGYLSMYPDRIYL